ncbi:carbohydrate esterase family 4 protein [Botryobasidium botryosum FD-172 SS1]|uniref:chitin deacetylase n=1 Tax=Botryobasidium botryosum (strain FD-172 SS1) TaxID=930990 RepID=A0A067MWX3_BOTB1|nr:carbohydrate esterase family 4 protein [Botryobasidium botryosum FD-172 SS1]
MKLLLASPALALSFFSVVAATYGPAQGQRHRDYVQRRQAAPTGTTNAAPTPAAPAPTALTPATEIPPLAQITSGAPTQATEAMFTTFTAGATPPISGAPPLPTASLDTTRYPALDVVPPTNSAQVQQWLQEIANVNIPNLAPTVDGTCATDAAAAADAQARGWWTCGGYTRPDDIVVCVDKHNWGVTFDDGPSPYTPRLLDYLNQQQIKATFFVVGSRVVTRPNMLQTEYMLGHQISVHTWSHHALTSLTNEQIVAELGWTRQAIKDVLGVTPTTMRPPFGDIDDRVRAISMAMGMKPIIWTDAHFDTDDWQIPAGNANGTSSLAAFNNILAASDTIDTGFIVLEHDLFQQTVDMAVGYFFPAARAHQPTITFNSVIQCLHQPEGNAYKETFANATSPSGGGSSGSGSGSSGSAGSAPGSKQASNAVPEGMGLSVILSSVAGAVMTTHPSSGFNLCTMAIQPQAIEDALRNAIPVEHLEILDQSSGCGENYAVIVVSPAFEGKPALARHRMVNELLKDQIAQMHAFSQKSLTPKQWEAQKAKEAASTAT